MKKYGRRTRRSNEAASSDGPVTTPVVATTRILPWVTGIVAFFMYVRTVTPGMQLGDGTEFATMAHVLGVPHPTGYPLYMLLLKAWLVLTIGGEVILRTTLFNCVCMAVAVAVLTSTLLRTIRSAWPHWPEKLCGIAAATGAISTGLLRYHWDSTAVTEVYALEFLIMVLFLRAVQAWDVTQGKRTRLLLALLVGLGLAHHRISVFLLLPFALVWWRQKNNAEHLNHSTFGFQRQLVPVLAVIAGCLLLYLYLPMRGASAPLAWGDTTTLQGFLDHVRGKEYFFRSMLRAGPDRPFTFDTWLPFAVQQAQDFFVNTVGQFLPLQERTVPNQVVGRYFASFSPVSVLVWLLFAALSVVGFAAWLKAARLVAVVAVLIAVQNFIFLFIYNIPDIRDYTLFPLAFTWLCAFLGGLSLLNRVIATQPLHEFSKCSLNAGYALLLLPLLPAAANWNRCAHSGDAAAEEISALYLPNSKEIMPENSILLTAGDVDSFTSWYRQHVRQERRDVTVFATNFIHMPWYPRFFTPQQRQSLRLTFATGVARGPQEFADQVDRGVIAPNIDVRPIFTSMQDHNVLPLLAKKYKVQVANRAYLEEAGTTLTLYRIAR